MSRSPLQPQKTRDFKCTSGILDKIPAGVVVNTYPFYDGNIEMSLVNNDRFVVGHTNSYCIYEFWRCIQTDPEQVVSVLPHISPFKSPKMFYAYQDRFEKYPDPFARSGIFFMMNQISDSGLVSSGEQKREQPSAMSISNLKRFNCDNLYVKFDNTQKLEEIFSSAKQDEYLVLYCGRHGLNIFQEGRSVGPEETEIIHDEVFKFFTETSVKTLLLYYASKDVFSKYKDYNIEMFNKWGIKTNSMKDCSEVTIANF